LRNAIYIFTKHRRYVIAVLSLNLLIFLKKFALKVEKIKHFINH